jgi:hypothetical protein
MAIFQDDRVELSEEFGPSFIKILSIVADIFEIIILSSFSDIDFFDLVEDRYDRFI